MHLAGVGVLATLEGREVRCGGWRVQPHVFPAHNLREQIVVWVVVQRSHLHAEWTSLEAPSSIPCEPHKGFANDGIEAATCPVAVIHTVSWRCLGWHGTVSIFRP